MDIRAYKNELREYYSQKRRSLPDVEKKRLDDLIADRFLNMAAYKHAKQILLYASTEMEISTYKIFQKALCDRKKCFFPKCYDHSKMDFFRIESENDFMIDAYNIKAPANEAEKYCPQPSDIIIVPALSYDFKGFRLGYGKGFYDRFLIDFLGTRIGLCYSGFMTNELPRGRYDLAVNVIVTEKRFILL